MDGRGFKRTIGDRPRFKDNRAWLCMTRLRSLRAAIELMPVQESENATLIHVTGSGALPSANVASSERFVASLTTVWSLFQMYLPQA